MKRMKHDAEWYFENVRKYANSITKPKVLEIFADKSELWYATKNGGGDTIQFRDLTSDENINRRLERATEPKSREIFAEIRRFCRDGMMVGLHTEFPKIYDED